VDDVIQKFLEQLDEGKACTAEQIDRLILENEGVKPHLPTLIKRAPNPFQ
jgi:hypothetical protein